MPDIQKSDLQYDDYSWTAIRGDDPRKTGRPDDVLLNRREGYEMLAFLTTFTSTRKDVHGNPLTKAHAQKAERLIRKHLPGDIRSRKDIAQWLINNWSNY